LAGDPRLVDASIDATAAQTQAEAASDHVTHVQIGAYASGDVKVVAVIGEIPSGWNRDRDAFMQGLGSGANSSLTAVSAGPKGGSVSCGLLGTGPQTVCAWVDDGTVGLVITNDPAPQAAETYLQALRSAAEH
jgi:hypothetical protein